MKNRILTFAIITLFLICCTLQTTFAQQITVKSFNKLTTDTEARINPVQDQNGDNCAIIKIETTVKAFKFDGDMMGIVKIKEEVAEIWVYLPAKSKSLTIKHDKYGILRNYSYPVKIESETVYLMQLSLKEEEKQPETLLTEMVSIHTEPTGADIYIDETNAGVTPYDLEMKEGKYNYRISKDLYYNEAGTFDLKAGEKLIKNITLRPNFGFAQLNTTPAGALVSIDGNGQTQTTPFKTNRLKSGMHTITVSYPMYYTETKTIEIKDNQTETIDITLKPAFDDILVRTEPESDAEVSVDGQAINKKTPCVISKLADGEHTITVRRQWYEPKTIKITVNGKQKSEPIKIEMKPTYGTVNISTIKDADIYIDNQKVGVETYKCRLLNGLHTLEAKKDKHQTDTKKLEIQIADSLDITLTPKPITGEVKIVTQPNEANIFIDNENRGTTPIILRKMLIGNYSLKLSKTGYADITKTIVVTENKTTEINETFSNVKDISFSSKPSGAELYIDEKYIGKTTTRTSVTFGKHSIMLKSNNFEDFTSEINVGNISESSYDFAMRSNLYKEVSKYKTRKNIWLTAGAISLAGAGFTAITANSYYNKYQTATSEATNLHKQVQLFDALTYSISAVATTCIATAIVNKAKMKKVQRKIE